MNTFAATKQRDRRQDEYRRRLPLEAFEDVDAGRVIDHQAVQAWAARLGADTPIEPPK